MSDAKIDKLIERQDEIIKRMDQLAKYIQDLIDWTDAAEDQLHYVHQIPNLPKWELSK